MATTTPPTRTSELRRVFLALPFLCLSVGAFFSMDMVGMVLRPSPSATGRIEWDSGSVNILERFHFLRFVDEIFRDVTVGFAPSSFGFDPSSWWQMVVFLNDAGLLHLVWLLESSRQGAKGTSVYFPTLWGTVAQLGGGGIMMPLYYLPHIVFYRPALSKSKPGPRINLDDVSLYVPMLLVFHTVPVIGMYFAADMQTRHWWTWLWQLYPIRISIAYYMLRTLRSVFWRRSSSASRTVATYHATLRLWVAPLILVSTAAWVYTLISAPHSLSTIFLPKKVPAELEDTFVGLMRRLLQWDQWYVMGAAFLWLFYLMGDLFAAGKTSTSQLLSSLALPGLTLFIGPGPAFTVMYLFREAYLVDGEEKEGGKKSA